MSQEDRKTVSIAKVDWSVKNRDYFRKILKQAQDQEDEKRRATALKTKEEVEQFLSSQMEATARANKKEGEVTDLNTTLSRAELDEIVDNVNRNGQHLVSIHDIRYESYNGEDSPVHFVHWRF
jgi:hypothetical protein